MTITGSAVRSFAEFMFEALSSKNEMLMKYGEQWTLSLSCVYYTVVILGMETVEHYAYRAMAALFKSLWWEFYRSEILAQLKAC